MAYNILLNKKVFHLKEDDLPCLVTYRDKTGGSHFSVTAIADLFLQGSKILFLTAYPWAKDNFLQQIQGSDEKVIYVEHKNDLEHAKDFQAIILKSGDADLYLEALKILSDMNERIVFIKNIEFFDWKIFEASLKVKKIILSGDIDKCAAKNEISNKSYKTIVAFSKTETKLPIEIPDLEKYSGYLWSENNKGLVTVEM